MLLIDTAEDECMWGCVHGCSRQYSIIGVCVQQGAATMPRQSQRGRRLSLPDVHQHEPRSPNWLHSMIQSFRRASSSRSHNSSISRVPEESGLDTEDKDEVDEERFPEESNMDTEDEDELDQER